MGHAQSSRIDTVIAAADKLADGRIDRREIVDQLELAASVYQYERYASKLANEIFWDRIYPKMTKGRHHTRLSKAKYPAMVWPYLITELVARGYQFENGDPKCTIRWSKVEK